MVGDIRTLVVLAVSVMPTALCAQPGRVDRNQLVLYDFDEAGGPVVHDRAPNGPPLDLLLVDPASVRWGRGFLKFQTETTLKSKTPALKVIEGVRRTNEISIEVWVRPSNLTQQGPARLVSISSDPGHRNITFGQQGEAWEVRLRTDNTSENGLPSLVTGSGDATVALSHVVYTRDAFGKATVYVDGVEKASKKVDGDFSGWDETFPLLLANERTADRAWLGELHLVAIYGCALSFEEIRRNFEAGVVGDQQRIAAMLPPAVSRAVDFVADVQPILREHCYECHASGNEEGNLNLAIKLRAMEGGQHGAVLVRGKSAASVLVHLVSGVEQDRLMPPDGNSRLTRKKIGVLRAWIDQGADWPANADVLDPKLERAREHWAFRRLKAVSVPDLAASTEPAKALQASSPSQRTNAADWVRTPIDAFVVAKLQEQQINVSPPASSRSLLRRLCFDLVGLPPEPQKSTDFTLSAATDPTEATRQLVDELLDSPRYGERWGRHWLDLARYADSDGQESDRDRPDAYRYRDFVIRAFNDDMPFDQFVRWQIAGDEYEPKNVDAVVATGFLTGGPCSQLKDSFLEEERLFNRYNELDDVVSTLGSSLLGLTVGCARCHDHKYDAFSAREYYRLLSAFHSGDRKAGELPDGSEGLFFRDFDAQVDATWLFRRSNFYDRELEVQLGFPAILSGDRDAESYWRDARASFQNESGAETSTLQRRALADWITDVEQGGGGLLARVIVNRIWQHHFGQGLVRTESDFGVRSDPPTHPELLEFLAHDFVENGWKIKRLHRMILNSSVWQQSSRDEGFDGVEAHAAGSVVEDPENRLLARRTPQRLEAEVLRDAMLAVSGTLNLEAFGPGFKPFIPAEANQARNIQGGNYPTDAKDNAATRRRSVYMFHKRLVPYPLFQAFDRPDFLVSCARRQDTTVAPQAMALLNDQFVRAVARDFATRLIKTHGSKDESLVDEAFELAFTRSPTGTERTASVEFIRRQNAARTARDEQDTRLLAVTDYCQSLIGLDEFIYVD